MFVNDKRNMLSISTGPNTVAGMSVTETHGLLEMGPNICSMLFSGRAAEAEKIKD